MLWPCPKHGAAPHYQIVVHSLIVTTEPEAETYRVARLTIRDVTVVVVLADGGFAEKSPAERQRVYENLCESLRQSDPGCDAAILWEDGEGRTRFIAQPRQEPFFEIVRFDQIRAQANQTVKAMLG